MDNDLKYMSPIELINEVQKLRDSIREHRDNPSNRFAWYHPKMWCMLPEKVVPDAKIPSWATFIKGCISYRHSLDHPLPKDAKKVILYEDR